MMKTVPVLSMAIAFVLVSLPGHAAQPSIRNKTVILQGLDKITARINSFRAPIGQPTRFGSLEITPKACFSSTPTEPPESAAFLQIAETQADAPAKPLFSGWMFASSPALSALEHPIYDVWVLSCADPVDAESPPPAVSLPEPPSDPDAAPVTSPSPNG
ncbi:hypothetical protein SAMN07250955_10289 [Arboricoccus pini]|uniref:Cellulase n=1 Tax=Arboricoccus pini TaxID=1963835 RepID=A0A212QNW4_9PROT|nr:DUF2155 domain-containing protein [Arboricoccus pini]SNB60938.1 hypothetical protein SAMN07250955_10289 [Arboricoccus pini]